MYSRRYMCWKCGYKGRMNRKEANTGFVKCIKCKARAKGVLIDETTENKTYGKGKMLCISA